MSFNKVNPLPNDSSLPVEKMFNNLCIAEHIVTPLVEVIPLNLVEKGVRRLKKMFGKSKKVGVLPAPYKYIPPSDEVIKTLPVPDQCISKMLENKQMINNFKDYYEDIKENDGTLPNIFIRDLTNVSFEDRIMILSFNRSKCSKNRPKPSKSNDFRQCPNLKVIVSSTAPNDPLTRVGHALTLSEWTILEQVFTKICPPTPDESLTGVQHSVRQPKKSSNSKSDKKQKKGFNVPKDLKNVNVSEIPKVDGTLLVVVDFDDDNRQEPLTEN